MYVIDETAAFLIAFEGKLQSSNDHTGDAETNAEKSIEVSEQERVPSSTYHYPNSRQIKRRFFKSKFNTVENTASGYRHHAQTEKPEIRQGRSFR